MNKQLWFYVLFFIMYVLTWKLLFGKNGVGGPGGLEEKSLHSSYKQKKTWTKISSTLGFITQYTPSMLSGARRICLWNLVLGGSGLSSPDAQTPSVFASLIFKKHGGESDLRLKTHFLPKTWICSDELLLKQTVICDRCRTRRSSPLSAEVKWRAGEELKCQLCAPLTVHRHSVLEDSWRGRSVFKWALTLPAACFMTTH